MSKELVAKELLGVPLVEGLSLLDLVYVGVHLDLEVGEGLHVEVGLLLEFGNNG